MIICELKQNINGYWISRGFYKTYDLAKKQSIRKNGVFKIELIEVRERLK